MRPRHRGARRRGAGLDRHQQGRGGPGRRGRRGHADQRRRRPRCHAVAADTRRRLGGHAHAGRAPRRCSTTPTTTTWWPRCATSCVARGRGRRAPPASTRSGSTPASASARPPTHNLALLAHLDELVGHRVPGRGRARAASGSSARSWPTPTGSTSRCRPTTGSKARWPPRRGPWPQGAAMVRVHDVRATVAAARRGRRHDRAWAKSHGGTADGREGQVGPGHRAPQLHAGSSRTSSPSASGRVATAPTTAGCAARRRSSGSASRGSPCVISLIPSPHNLHNYDELGVAWLHRPVR